MKCRSCGKELRENVKICDNCGYESTKQKVIIIEEDPDVAENKKSSLIDAPILTFIFGLLAVLTSLVFVAYFRILSITAINFIFISLFVYLTFHNGKKPAKVKLKPVANVGKGMAYFSIGFILLKIIFEIIGLLFF